MSVSMGAHYDVPCPNNPDKIIRGVGFATCVVTAPGTYNTSPCQNAQNHAANCAHDVALSIAVIDAYNRLTEECTPPPPPIEI